MKKKNSRYFPWLLAAFALAVGVVFVYPDARFVAESAGRYKDIAPLGFPDEIYYLGRINGVYKGDYLLKNPAIREHTAAPIVMPPLPELVQGGIGRLLGLDIATLDMAATFVLPATLFLLMYSLAYTLSGSRYGSIAAGLALLFGAHFFSRPFLLTGRIFDASYTLPLWFSRPISPQMHFVFFLSALLFTCKAVTGGAGRRYVLPAAFFLGCLFYVSVFYWVFTYAMLAVLILLFHLEREDEMVLKRLFPIAIIAAFLSLPYWFENARTLVDANYSLLLERINAEYTRRPVFLPWSIALFALLVLARRFLIARFGKAALHIMTAMAAAVILTLNQQVLTGTVVEESHFRTYTGKFVLILVGVLVGTTALKTLAARVRFRWLPAATTVLFFTSLFIHAIGLQSNYYLAHRGETERRQELRPLFDWFRKNTAATDVILPTPRDTRLSELIPVYTHNFVYYSEPFFTLSLIPAAETQGRMVAAYRLFRFSEREALDHRYSWDGAMFLANDTYRPAGFAAGGKEKLKDVYARAHAEDPLNLVRRYKADYVVGRKGSENNVLSALVEDGAEKMYDDGTYFVVKLRGPYG